MEPTGSMGQPPACLLDVTLSQPVRDSLPFPRDLRADPYSHLREPLVDGLLKKGSSGG
jgi:hypothetical protein